MHPAAQLCLNRMQLRHHPLLCRFPPDDEGPIAPALPTVMCEAQEREGLGLSLPPLFPVTSGEPFLSPFLCRLSHTAQSLGHSFPALCRARVGLNDVLLGPRSSLPNLRQRFLPFVRLVHRYYCAVRLLLSVHVRIVALGLHGPVSSLVGPRRPGDLPVLVHIVSQRAVVPRLRRAGRSLAIYRNRP